MVLDVIGELLAPVIYGLGYILLRLVGVKHPSERACSIVSALLGLVILIGLVYVLSRP